MTQLAAGSVSEAEVMHAAILAFAKSHVDTAADVIARAVQDLEAVLENVPAVLPEHGHLVEAIAMLDRYAALLGYAEPELMEQAPTLGVARRLAIEAVNRAADIRVDAIVIEWGRSADLPVLEVARLTDAAMATGLSIANRRALGETLGAKDLDMAGALDALQQRQLAIRFAQRDHVREIDRLEEIAAIRAYPDTAAWPE